MLDFSSSKTLIAGLYIRRGMNRERAGAQRSNWHIEEQYDPYGATNFLKLFRNGRRYDSRMVQYPSGEEGGTGFDIKRAICHEVGHTTAALHFGFHVETVGLLKGMPRVVIGLDGTENAMIVLASGIASEKLHFGNYDAEASGHDEGLIAEHGGGSITDYISEACRVVDSHEQFVRRLRKVMSLKWTANQAEIAASYNFQTDSESLEFELVSSDEIERIWSEASLP